MCIHILIREYLKELTPSLGRRCCTFQKKSFLFPPPFRTFFLFRIFFTLFPVSLLPFPSLLSCLSTQEDLLARRCNAIPRENKSFSPKFPFPPRDTYSALVFYPFSFLKEKGKNTKTSVYIYYTFFFFW